MIIRVPQASILALITFAGLLFVALNVSAKEEIISSRSLINACHANGFSTEKYAALLQQDLTRANDKHNQSNEFSVDPNLALQLLNCLASPDPKLRDEIAFELSTTWLRANLFTVHTYKEMFNVLLTALNANVDDKYDVYQPFAALMLSEVVRVDRNTPFLSDEDRNKVVNTVSRYFIQTVDYRGFDEKIGWRHAVAHSADVMLQLALNPAINKTQLSRMLNALSSQIVPINNHFYHYGEPKRIAMAVIYIMLRKHHSDVEWQEWVTSIVSPSPFKQWNNMYKSEQGLAKLHNTRAFLYSLYAVIKPSENETLVKLIPAIEQAIETIN